MTIPSCSKFCVSLRLSTIVILGACAILPAPACAEDLIQVFELARQHDASILAADAQYQAAAPRLARARGALLPVVNMVASSTDVRAGVPGDADRAGVHADNRANVVTLRLRQPLFNAALGTDVSIAKVAEQSAQIDFDITMQDFILRVAQAYFDVLATQDVLETKQLSKASIDAQVDAAIRRFKAGLGIITDQEDAQARASLAEAEEMAAGNDVRIAQLALQRLTGRPGIVAQKMAVQSAASRISAGRLDQWLRDAASHPSVERSKLALDRAKLDTRRAHASGLPTVDLVGSVARNRVSGEASALSSLTVGRSNNSSLGVEMNLPLFAGFTRHNLVKENVLLQEQARNNLDAAIQASEGNAERAYFELQTAMARATALAAAETASRSSLAGTQQGYKAGLRPNLDVLNAQAQLYQTRSDLDRVRYDVLLRSLKLKAAAGKLDLASLAELNRLIAASPPPAAAQ
ncbi:TolC family outer membrane protein [Janthinobacterium sp. FT14W]|uniref:TolC family outer membrane protein n=1 Tax=Janthinobacterium sp. FT14W TaxID=2654253 RepID=UPI0012652E3C|nr:TolC family outer membrane protein [Janthinobacterium sp. FT14W]KAB8061470.1 TolC family outer membrane protein [Janthinobacterium sp. FT14W]